MRWFFLHNDEGIFLINIEEQGFQTQSLSQVARDWKQSSHWPYFKSEEKKIELMYCKLVIVLKLCILCNNWRLLILDLLG